MPSDAIFAHGTTIKIGSTPVGGLTGIGLPDQSKDDVDVTTHDSGGDKEYIPGLREGGTVSLEGENLPDDAGQIALRANYDADHTVATFIITLPAPSGATYTFDGYVNGLGGTNPDDDKATFSGSIKVTGPVVMDES